MPTSTTLHINVPDDLATELNAAVSSGDYATITEAVAEALNEWRLRRRLEAATTDELRGLIRAGMESGPGLDATQVFAELRASMPSDRPTNPAE